MISNAFRNVTLQQLAAIVLMLIALATLVIFCYDEVTGHSVDSSVQTLIAFLTGVVSTILGFRGGSNSAGSNTRLSSTDSGS